MLRGFSHIESQPIRLIVCQYNTHNLNVTIPMKSFEQQFVFFNPHWIFLFCWMKNNCIVNMNVNIHLTHAVNVTINKTFSKWPTQCNWTNAQAMHNWSVIVRLLVNINKINIAMFRCIHVLCVSWICPTPMHVIYIVRLICC